MAYAEPLRRRHQSAPARRALRALLCALALAFTAAAVADLPIPDLREIERENDQLASLIEEIDATRARRAADRAAFAERLARDELRLYSDDISAEALRQARLRLDSVQSRTAVLQGRIEQRTLALERLRRQIAQLERAIAGAADDEREASVRDLRNEVARDLLAGQAQLTEQIIASYGEALHVNRRYVTLLEDHLRLLQSRLRLSELESAGLFAQDPRVPLLESVIADHLRRAARLVSAASGMKDSDPAQAEEPAQQARLRALEMRIDDAVTRSFLRQNDLELILAGNALDDLRALRRDELMPLHVLRGAERRLAGVADDLAQIAEALTGQRDVLRSKRAALTRHSSDEAPDLVLLEDLDKAIDLQQADIEQLREAAQAEQATFDRVIAERYAGALAERRHLPDSADDWRRLADNALHLPQLLSNALGGIWEALRTGTASAGPARNALALAAGLGLLLLVLAGRRLLRRWCAAQDPDSRLAELVRPLARVLPALLPALLWLLVVIAYDLTGDLIRPILLILLLPALLGFVLALTRELLYAQPQDAQAHPGADTTPGRAETDAAGTVTDDPQTPAMAAAEPVAGAGGAEQTEPATTRALQAPSAPPAAVDTTEPTEQRTDAEAPADAQPVTAAASTALRSRKAFYRKLRLGLLLAAAVAAAYILTSALPLAPILADLLDRLAMLGVLALALPAFALYGLFRGLAAQSGRRRLVAATVASLSRLLPLFLLAVGLTGLIGYINLAWALLTYLAWAVVVGLLLAFVIGVLADLRDRTVEHLLPASAPAAQPAADAAEPWDELHPATPEGSLEDTAEQAPADGDDGVTPTPAPAAVTDELAEFWRTHFVEPGYRLGVLLAVLGAGWLLFALWDWHADTPVVRWLLALIDTPLLKLGESAFTIADILLAVVLVASVFYIAGWSQQVSYNLAYRRVRDAGLRQALATFTQYVIIVAGVLLALRIIGFDITTLTVFAASLGVGIGFGLQNIINNFVSGVLLLAERPLKVGDFVSIGSNLGSVTRIGIRSLTMRTLDKQEVIIPNGSVISGEFTNWTRSDDLLRSVHYIRIRYEDDAELAIRLIERILRRHPYVLSDPEPGVFLWEYSESSVDIRVQYCFSMNDGPGTLGIRSQVLLAIGRSFREHGIKMPHAKRDVTMHLDEDSRGLLAGLGAPKPEL
ncbi:hypothetical protein CKO31_09065 [Thiohalocapsa halophila]|uniref:Mechanosensitive ion channel n=3 Tax=Chromatiaceae TaxID=1046 RepID=A0ABS1CG41_9GAMM|nr:hypothetical protein [Thiohalocapsa halophila]